MPYLQSNAENRIEQEIPELGTLASLRNAEIDGWNQAVAACIAVIHERNGAGYVGPWTRDLIRAVEALREVRHSDLA